MTTSEAPLTEDAASVRGEVVYSLTWNEHWDACPAHKDRVRNKGACTCGVVDEAHTLLNRYESAIRASHPPSDDDECLRCGWKRDGHPNALCSTFRAYDPTHALVPRDASRPPLTDSPQEVEMPDGTHDSTASGPYMTVEEVISAQVYGVREKQRRHGYTVEHDREHVANEPHVCIGLVAQYMAAGRWVDALALTQAFAEAAYLNEHAQ